MTSTIQLLELGAVLERTGTGYLAARKFREEVAFSCYVPKWRVFEWTVYYRIRNVLAAEPEFWHEFHMAYGDWRPSP